jgi:hypothetical protein
MRSNRELRIRIVDTPFDPDSESLAIEVDHARSPAVYKIWVYLEGPDLPFVDKVTYHLHSSFRNPTKVVRRTPSNTDCRLVLRTWGIFTIDTEIELQNGNIYELSHRLSYNEMFDRPGITWRPMESKPSDKSRARRVTKKAAKKYRRRR